MYRPEGWDNPLTKARLRAEHNDFNIVDEAFEAGADAMLEGLKPYFKKVRKMCEDVKPIIEVFIPEDRST